MQWTTPKTEGDSPMTTTSLTADDVRSAVLRWPGLYEDPLGRRFMGMPVSQAPKQLIECGWRNVSRLDKCDFEKMGLEIVTARYVGGVKPKKFCDVIVASR
jgi:hypothetical protein